MQSTSLFVQQYDVTELFKDHFRCCAPLCLYVEQWTDVLFGVLQR